MGPPPLSLGTLIPGAPGAGKTETALRLARILAGEDPELLVVYLDGKGERGTADRFEGLMRESGRRVAVWPDLAFDGWRGGAQELANRLLVLPDFAEEGPAAYYRDIAEVAVSLAVSDPAKGPPRDFPEFLFRLDPHWLAAAHGEDALAGISGDRLREVRMRYQAIALAVGAGFDGSWGWEDVGAAYFLLDSLALQRHTKPAARMIFEDFAQFFRLRKEPGRRVLFIADEFSALAEAGGMAERIEQARSANVGFALLPQSEAGMGGREESDRIRSAIGTVLLHRSPEPEAFVRLAGTHLRPEFSQQIDAHAANTQADDNSRSTGRGSIRLQHQHRVDPNQVRALRPGEAVAIHAGAATRLRVLRAEEPARAGDAWASIRRS